MQDPFWETLGRKDKHDCGVMKSLVIVQTFPIVKIMHVCQCVAWKMLSTVISTVHAATSKNRNVKHNKRVPR